MAGAAECRDTFVRFDNLASTSAGRTPPATGVSTLDECRARCLRDDDCAGFNWMRDGRNDTDKCLLYDGLVGDTSEVTLFDLYARERCQPNMFITFGPGMPLTHTHTHAHTRLTALFPGLHRRAGTRKVKPIWMLLKQETVSSSGISWAICKSAPHSRQITTPAPHHPASNSYTYYY